jgi:hypothetical protein
VPRCQEIQVPEPAWAATTFKWQRLGIIGVTGFRAARSDRSARGEYPKMSQYLFLGGLGWAVTQFMY